MGGMHLVELVCEHVIYKNWSAWVFTDSTHAGGQHRQHIYEGGMLVNVSKVHSFVTVHAHSHSFTQTAEQSKVFKMRMRSPVQDATLVFAVGIKPDVAGFHLPLISSP